VADAVTAIAVDDLVAALTLDEKVLLLEGTDFWHTHAIERLGIPSLTITDGPHGVRRARVGDGAFGVSDNLPATAFPTSVTVANSWDPELARRMGAALGRESVDRGVHVLLAPGVNLKRGPLCGRNFEYYSEDPLVSGAFGAALVDGIQSEGVAASVKHFAANSSEDYRFGGDSLVDERALRELYLRQFERVVTQARPATVMCAYNAINGTFSSDNRELLTGILREEWGFDGLVITDWGATHDRVASLLAGCELDMPGDNAYNRDAIHAAVRDGRIPVAVLDEAVRRMLALVERTHREVPENPVSDAGVHQELAIEIAERGAVLLQNDGTLPLPGDARGLVVVGELFERMRFQGAGSSLVNPTEVVSPRDAFDRRGVGYDYARGYRAMDPSRDAALEREAIGLARDARTVLFFGGLTDLEESEGFDRTTMALGEAQVALLRALIATGTPVVLVLFAGAPVELPFADEVAAILYPGLPGMQGGEAVARLLFGEANPSGRLSESWTHSAADSSALDYNQDVTARYAESIYVGYRYHDKAGTPLRYAFGHGLSYTNFEYQNVEIEQHSGRVLASVTIANIGDRDGAEVVQLYVRNNQGAVFKADKELRAFAKVELTAGATARVELGFDLVELAYWDVADHGWRLENGEYELLVAASAADIRLTAPLSVTSGAPSRSPYPAELDRDYATPPGQVPPSFPALLGHPVPEPIRSRRLGMETRLIDARGTIIGGIMRRAVLGQVKKMHREAVMMPDSSERDLRVKSANFMLRMMVNNTMRSMAMSSSGALSFRVATGLTQVAAWKPIRGLRSILGKG
jgi:beta-glucosidase